MILLLLTAVVAAAIVGMEVSARLTPPHRSLVVRHPGWGVAVICFCVILAGRYG